MTGNVQIREATSADRTPIGRLWLELMGFHCQFDPQAFELRDDALDIWLRWLDEWLADPDRIVLVAEAGQALVGYVMGRPEEGPPVFKRRRHGAIHETCVATSWRRRGVGRKLVAALLDWFRARGMPEVRVTAWASNPISNAFWQAMGFQPKTIGMNLRLDLTGE